MKDSSTRGVCVPVGVAVEVSEGVAEGVGVSVISGVGVGVSYAVGVEVTVGVGVGAVVGVLAANRAGRVTSAMNLDRIRSKREGWVLGDPLCTRSMVDEEAEAGDAPAALTRNTNANRMLALARRKKRLE